MLQPIDGTDKDQTKNIRTGFAAILIRATLDGLLPNREYTIKIRAVNVVGSGIYSEPLTFKTSRLGKIIVNLTQIRHQKN